jgi:hypothetical protein
VDKEAEGQVLAEYFGFSCHSFHRLANTQHHSSSGADTIDQLVADVPSVQSLTQILKTNKQTNSVALVCKQTKPTERQPLVGEVNASFCG